MWFEEKWEESTSKSVISYDNLKKKKEHISGENV